MNIRKSEQLKSPKCCFSRHCLLLAIADEAHIDHFVRACSMSVEDPQRRDGTPLPVDPAANRYPHCIVWTPLPLITWIFPFIGHMGIADSRGVIHDFAAPYQVNEEHMAFGNPTRYLQLSPQKSKRKWDDGIKHADSVYCKRMHNLVWDNCHNHVAEALNFIEYDGPAWWCGQYNMVVMCFWVFFCGSRPTLGGILCQWGKLW